MALILKDRVKETSSSSGTGSVTLGGAFPGYQTFDAVVATGSTVYYTIHNLTAGVDNEWEVGVGTFTSPTTLSRDTVLSSSAGGTTKVNFTAGASGLEVFITQPAEEAIYLNQATGKVEVGGNGTNTVSFTNINTTNLTATTVTLTAGTITTNAANATDIVNKLYVDTIVASGVHFHEPVRVESPIDLDATYDNGTDGVGATLTNAGTQAALVIDGVTMVVADRVLIYEQADATENGVYVVTNIGSDSTNWILTRSDDTNTYGVDSPNSLSEGSTFYVTSGNTGAGETYTCNTEGVIIFGTTDITFAQISSAQVYSAGTGLNLTNLSFNISNTAVTAAQYGNDGAVGQFTVNAQGQLTNAANVSINASSITVGTLANARTTASDANGASTIVARDATGSFTANTITATTSNATTFNGTTGAFTSVSGNGVALTAINASNVTSGTLDNARTTGNTANSASTIVLRDADGSFGANIVTATFSGNGATLSAINASNISSGTIANARTTAASANGASTIVLRDSGGSFDANLVNAVSLSGNAATVTGINASNVASGTIANARTTAATANGASTIVLRGASGEFAAGAITGTSFSGNGSTLTAINASAITTGTLDNARTSATSANGASTIVVRDANGSFAGNVITGTTGTFTSVSGNGVALTAINASNISSGTVATARLGSGTANASTFLRGDQTYAVVSSGTLIPSGTVMLFQQTAAPTGFTKLTTHNDKALRVVSGTVSSGGTNPFTTAFGTPSVTGSVSISGNPAVGNLAVSISGNIGNTTLSVNTIPSHSHNVTFYNPASNFGTTFPVGNNAQSGSANISSGNTGNNGAHNHSQSLSGTLNGSPAAGTLSGSLSSSVANISVQYVDVIIASKD